MPTEPNMTIKLKDGTLISGPATKVMTALKLLGEFVPDGLHYNSSTLGVIRIKNMSTRHIKNAIHKYYRNWVEGMRSDLSTTDFINYLKNELKEDVTLLALVSELRGRLS